VTQQLKQDCHRYAGLDARAAVIVMHAIKNISKGGRTVLVTIHQPSIGNILMQQGEIAHGLHDSLVGPLLMAALLYCRDI
jgi:hypothetical protein